MSVLWWLIALTVSGVFLRGLCWLDLKLRQARRSFAEEQERALADLQYIEQQTLLRLIDAARLDPTPYPSTLRNHESG